LEKVVAQREIHVAEFSVPVAGGELSFETWLCPLEAGSVLAIVRNVTERKQLDQTIQKARSDLLFSISHEMKTPLMNIAAAREMLATLPEMDRQNRQLEYEETWERNLRRLRRLIDNLVDSQRVQTTGLTLLKAPCDLPAVIRRVLKEEATYAATRKVRLVEKMDAISLMDLDEETIERLLENLVTNAIKYSLPDGQVEIVLEQRTGEVVLSVSDHGCGIPAVEQVALFQPFQRGHSAEYNGIPGTGLGLYVAKIIAEAHGGSIELRSVTGEGTVVTVRFPLPGQAT
jgi:signal transduction histidine kinase